AVAIEVGVSCFNAESVSELELLNTLAIKRSVKVAVSLRINLGISAHTNRHIATGVRNSKFGIPFPELPSTVSEMHRWGNLELHGLACHLGSQITTLRPFQHAIRKMKALALSLVSSGIPLKHLNLGGGFGIEYKNEKLPSLEKYAQVFVSELKNTGLELVVEPGRSIVGRAGILLCRVLNTKKTDSKLFVIVDGAMNDLMRPALYNAYHNIQPALVRTNTNKSIVDIVGPICENTDCLGTKRKLVLPNVGDLLFITHCGAYGSSMASNYNARLRAPEVLVEGDRFSLIRRREAMQTLWAMEEFNP
ncbi:MAG: diaminopimelate decarboxylase, partial [Deltaproteobacteria bacterium]|nr:diaminopimelate decarboxylase [Deltaproteobacteria bacterium]